MCGEGLCTGLKLLLLDLLLRYYSRAALGQASGQLYGACKVATGATGATEATEATRATSKKEDMNDKVRRSK